jgi:HEAT repeat protein
MWSATPRLIAIVGLLAACVATGWLMLGQKGDPSHRKLNSLLGDLCAQDPFYFAWMYRSGLMAQDITLRKWVSSSEQKTYWKGQRAADSLRALGTNSWPVVPGLLRALEHRNVNVGLSAASVLAAVKAEKHPDWPVLRKRLEGSSQSVRVFHYLLTGMTASGPYSFSCRRFALIGLDAARPAALSAYPDLIGIVNSNEEMELRTLAMIAVARMDSKRAHVMPMLKHMLQDGQEWADVSAAAAEALAFACPQDAEVQALLRQGLEDERSQVRLAAARGLWRSKVPANEVLPVLTSLLNHKLVKIRTGALNALSEMGSAAQASRAEVERLASDENESVRLAAVSTLQRLEGSVAESQRVHSGATSQ